MFLGFSPRYVRRVVPRREAHCNQPARLPRSPRFPPKSGMSPYRCPGRLPGLRLPCRLEPSIIGLSMMGGVAGTVVITPGVRIGNAIVLGTKATVVTLLPSQVASRPLAIAFPHGVVTVGDLEVATLPPGFENAARQQMTDQEVWENAV